LFFLLLPQITTTLRSFTDLDLHHQRESIPMDSQYQNALTIPGTSFQASLPTNASAPELNMLEFKVHKPGAITMGQDRGVGVWTSCRPMTREELGANGTSGTLFEGHIVPGKLCTAAKWRPCLDGYCQNISDIVNHPRSGYVMIETAAELEHELSEHQRLSRPGELDQKKYSCAASQFATVLEAEHQTAEKKSLRSSAVQFNAIKPDLGGKLQDKAQREEVTAEKNTAPELVRLMQRGYGQETIRAMTREGYEPPKTKGHVVFKNPDGKMCWIQKGTEVGTSLQGQTQGSTGRNKALEKKGKYKRYMRLVERTGRAEAVEEARRRNPSSIQLPKTSGPIGSHLEPGAHTEAFTQSPADPHGSMLQNEPQYPQGMSEYQPWAPNTSFGNWPQRPARQIDSSLQFAQASHPESLALGHDPFEDNYQDPSHQTPSFGAYFASGESSQQGMAGAYSAPNDPQGSFSGYALPEEGYMQSPAGGPSYQTVFHETVDKHSAQPTQTSPSNAVQDQRRSKRVLRPRRPRK
jgi:hypothetical protein